MRNIFGWYDVNSIRSFPLTYITSKIFLISSKKIWRSSLVYDPKNSGGLILRKSRTLSTMDLPFSLTWAWTRLFWLATFIDNILMAFLKSSFETFGFRIGGVIFAILAFRFLELALREGTIWNVEHRVNGIRSYLTHDKSNKKVMFSLKHFKALFSFNVVHITPMKKSLYSAAFQTSYET